MKKSARSYFLSIATPASVEQLHPHKIIVPHRPPVDYEELTLAYMHGGAGGVFWLSTKSHSPLPTSRSVGDDCCHKRLRVLRLTFGFVFSSSRSSRLSAHAHACIWGFAQKSLTTQGQHAAGG